MDILNHFKIATNNVVQRVLNKFKSNNINRTVRTDQGGELARSTLFQTMISKENFTLEITGVAASVQNGVAESPNNSLAQMMRCILHTAELGPEYLFYALVHAAYTKNRLPHSEINKNPFESLTGSKPDITNLRIFRSRICVKKPGKMPAKLDHHTSSGTFVEYTATTKNVYDIDDKTNNVKKWHSWTI